MTESKVIHTDHSSNEVRRILSAYAERERTHKSKQGNPGRQRYAFLGTGNRALSYER